MLVTELNLQKMMAELPEDQARELSPGCESWAIRTAAGVTGWMTVWPAQQVAAVSWGVGSFWGSWLARERCIYLDDTVHGRELLVDQRGELWAVVAEAEFRTRMDELFLRIGDWQGLAQVAAGQAEAPLKIKVGCSVLPILRGREMAAALLEQLQAGDPGAGPPAPRFH